MEKLKRDLPCKDLEEAVQNDPGSVELLKRLVACYMQQRSLDRAIATIKEIVRLEPGNSFARLNLGKVCLLAGK